MKSLAEIRDQIKQDLFDYRGKPSFSSMVEIGGIPHDHATGIGELVDSRAEELRASLVSLKRRVVSSIEDEFYPDGEDDDGVRCLIEDIKGRFDLVIEGRISYE
jgi:hypothetical protein